MIHRIDFHKDGTRTERWLSEVHGELRKPTGKEPVCVEWIRVRDGFWLIPERETGRLVGIPAREETPF